MMASKAPFFADPHDGTLELETLPYSTPSLLSINFQTLNLHKQKHAVVTRNHGMLNCPCHLDNSCIILSSKYPNPKEEAKAAIHFHYFRCFLENHKILVLLIVPKLLLFSENVSHLSPPLFPRLEHCMTAT